jgi:hypothetical protein
MDESVGNRKKERLFLFEKKVKKLTKFWPMDFTDTL